MSLSKNIIKNEIFEDESYITTNLVFSFFPISFILGNLVTNINIILFCCLGILHLKSKIILAKIDFPIKVIFIFFLTIIFSTAISVAKVAYFEGYNHSELIRFVKSILFLRFFLLLLIIYLLNKHNILNFNYFFLVAALSALIISLDVIYQYIVGNNIIGLKSNGYNNSSFFGSEYIAGGYIQRFAFFSIFFTTFFFKDKNYIRFILSVSVICLLALGIFFSGNRMPLILFIFGLSLILFLNLKLRKILLLSFLITILFLKFIFSSNEYYKSQYITFYTNFINIMTFSKDDLIDLRINPSGPVTKMILEEYNEKKLGTKEAAKSKVNHYDVKWESNHRRIFLSALDTWRLNKLLGNGIKSFRITCPKINRPGVNLGEDLYPEKINRLCANHPHNYYLEILTDTGSAGFVLIFIIGFLFIFFIIKNLKYLKENNLKNLILLSAILCLCLEGVPLRSSGSIFTSSNATYLILIGSIVLSNKKLLKTKI